ncbi:MAG: 3-dehydroquinate synthase [Clostridia bacterium]|nr:3-dehydroquinate synthase [Clostridia bacterium]
MADVQTVRVQAGGETYDIVIRPGALDARQGKTLAKRLGPWQGRRAAVVADERTGPLFGARVLAALAEAGIEGRLLTVPAGEASKCHRQLLWLYDSFLDMPLTRSDLVVALGGGVVGDLAGYAAATYQRGVPLVQIPTTLLAQVDSSVGGKVAVNLPRGKNLVGAFCQPALVIIDPHALNTLDPREFGAGLGEVIKYGCIADAALFERFENFPDRRSLLSELPGIIARCCEIKAGYVGRDPFDHGARMELNFGHTLGHALESALGYGALLHGEAVCVGMAAAARWGEALGVTPPGVAGRIAALLTKYELPVAAPEPISAGEIARAMALDKKADGDSVRLVLLQAIGRATVRSVRRDALAELLSSVQCTMYNVQ